jgi:hypothetical protein
MTDPEWNTDFHMPDSWYDPPDDDVCEECDNVGCVQCDSGMAADYAADVRMQRMKEEGW